MTDITSGSVPASPAPKTNTNLILAGLAKRNRKQIILQGFGLAAIGFAFLMLAILVGSLVATGYKAFTQTHLTVSVFVDPAEIPRDGLRKQFRRQSPMTRRRE